ncbi:MAG: flotillin family protein, partial [Clostridia bacterium]|nr:flotillin family protein [Clostridia bacterium]
MSPLAVGLTIGAVVLAVFLILFFAIGYMKAPPDTAYIISGPFRRKILIGRAGFRIPFFERVDKISLRVMQVDVKTSEAVPTNEFINVNVDGVANIKVSSNPDLLKKAAEALLGMKQGEQKSQAPQVVSGEELGVVGW